MNAQSAAATVTVNRQESVVWQPGMTVHALLHTMRYSFPRLVVIVNGTFVPHDAYEATEIPRGADVRVIHLMAGG